MENDPQTYPVPSELSGKIMHCRSAKAVVVMADWRFEMIGGRLFAIGKAPATGWPGYENKTVAIAWDLVESLYLFDDAGEWDASTRTYKAFKEKANRPFWYFWG